MIRRQFYQALCGAVATLFGIKSATPIETMILNGEEKLFSVNGKLVRIEQPKRIKYYKDGQFHRENGPAITNTNGTELWYVNGKRHRVDGPAITQLDGSKYWYFNNRLHREDGPAVEWNGGLSKAWYTHGHFIESSGFGP